MARPYRMKRSNSVLTLFINFTTENFCVSMKDSRLTLMAILTGLGDADHALDVTDGDGHGTCSFKDFIIFADFKNILVHYSGDMKILLMFCN